MYRVSVSVWKGSSLRQGSESGYDSLEDQQRPVQTRSMRNYHLPGTQLPLSKPKSHMPFMSRRKLGGPEQRYSNTPPRHGQARGVGFVDCGPPCVLGEEDDEREDEGKRFIRVICRRDLGKGGPGVGERRWLKAPVRDTPFGINKCDRSDFIGFFLLPPFRKTFRIRFISANLRSSSRSTFYFRRRLVFGESL